MNFMTRSLFGLMLITVTFALLAIAGNSIFNAFQNRSNGGFGNRQAQERVFTVEVAPFTLGTHFPEIKTYGEVISGRTLELRAAASGELVQISPNFREGGVVKKGEVLFQTDPANARSKLLISRNEFAEAEADLIDARRNLTLAQDEVKAAENQLSLRKKAMERQGSLRTRGIGTDTALETAELAASSAEQSLLAKRLSLANALAKIAKSETLLARRQINADEAERILSETMVVAEFDGGLTGVNAVLGRLVNANEKLGSVIDPGALEVAFRVSSDQYRALSATPNGLGQAQVRISINATTTFFGQIDRVSAAVDKGATGRELFAKVRGPEALGIQPGDFVTVLVREPALENVTEIPAAAASSNGSVLIVGQDNRLEEANVQILRKQGNSLIVRADDLAGRTLVLARAPQLGSGILVEPRAVGAPAIVEQKMVRLEPARREKILANLRANKRIPQPVRERLIRQFEKDEVPAQVLERVESRMSVATTSAASGTDRTLDTSADTGSNMGGNTGGNTGETVEISDEQRRTMIAFIQANTRMPAEVKTSVLEQLQQPRIPKSLVERITMRMGG